jgi:L,D-peptidoglycan transpeptidase YkuD (ErfK/YbiS/YcfS/YnhG family)
VHKLLGLACLLIVLCPCRAQIPESTSQLLIVTTADWSELHGVAQRYERHARRFEKLGASFPVVVGHTGLAWGRGLDLGSLPDGPSKREGDGKAPAGLFTLGTAFGYEASTTTRLPYLPLTGAIECVDDTDSAYYNQLVDSQLHPRTWRSSEQMRRSDELYHYGIFVNHNTPPTPNGGSCIFLHIWANADTGTVGCTAMDPANIRLLLQWLEPAKHPLLVQMPRAQYQQQRGAWHLP